MSPIAADPATFTTPAGLDLRTITAGGFEKDVKFRFLFLSAEHRSEDTLHSSDDIGTIGLITVFVAGFGILFYYGISRGFDQ